MNRGERTFNTKNMSSLKPVNSKKLKGDVNGTESFIPDAILYRYFLLLNPPIGQTNKEEIKLTKEDLKHIRLWLENGFKTFPHTPDIFFKKDYQIREGTDVKESSDSIVDSFFKIKYGLRRLMNYRQLIKDTLNGLKEEFESIIIDKSRYGIDPNNRNNVLPGFVIQNPTASLNDLFFKEAGKYGTFKMFVDSYMNKNNNNLFSYSGDSHKIPFFYRILMDNYKGNKIEFIKKIFKEYIQIRNKLIKQMKDYYGLIAFEPIFDITKRTSLKIIKSSVKTNNIKQTFEPNPLYNGIKANLEQTNTEGSYNALVKKMNGLEYNNNNNNNNEQREDKTRFNEATANGLDRAYEFMQLKTENNIYGQIGEENIHQFELKKKLTDIFKIICASLKIVYFNETPDLLQLIESHLDVDFTTIQFIFEFVQPALFLKALQAKSKIYEFIQKNIDLYQEYIEEFDVWIYNYLLGYKINPLDVGDTEFKKVYESFNDFISKVFEKSKKERATNRAIKLDNSGIYVDVSVPSQTNENVDEDLNKIIEALGQEAQASTSAPIPPQGQGQTTTT